MVTCNKCLQNLHIDSTWCVIQYNKRFYECKDVGLCIELRQHNFKKPQEQSQEQSKAPKPSAPPASPKYHRTYGFFPRITIGFTPYFLNRYSSVNKYD